MFYWHEFSLMAKHMQIYNTMIGMTSLGDHVSIKSLVIAGNQELQHHVQFSTCKVVVF